MAAICPKGFRVTALSGCGFLGETLFLDVVLIMGSKVQFFIHDAFSLLPVKKEHVHYLNNPYLCGVFKSIPGKSP